MLFCTNQYAPISELRELSFLPISPLITPETSDFPASQQKLAQATLKKVLQNSERGDNI